MAQITLFLLGILTGAVVSSVVYFCFLSPQEYDRGFEDAWNRHKKDAYKEVAREIRNSVLFGKRETRR